MRHEGLDDWQLKLYGIALPGLAPRTELVDAALAVAAEALPQPAKAEGRDGTGFVVVHDAATVCFALVYWWQNDNELHQRCFFSPLDDPAALEPIANPAAGCVWELEVIDFERRAWLADVLANPEGPDVDLYLSRHFDADV
jgi:hypothetical protein